MKSKELAAEALKKADLIKIEALKRADQIKTLAGEIETSIPLTPLAASQGVATEDTPVVELERFGVSDELREVSDELREFVKGIAMNTFRDFPMEDIDEPEIFEVPIMLNVRQDINK